MRADRNRFSSIVSEFSQPLYCYVRRIVVSHEDAEDILQETFIKVYRHLWQLRDETRLKSWIYRIATNEALAFIKKRIPLDEGGERLTELLMASEYVDFTREAEIKLQKALNTLSPQQRTVFCLKYYDDMDYAQIAEITGSSADTLKVSYHNAKERIKKYIDEN